MIFPRSARLLGRPRTWSSKVSKVGWIEHFLWIPSDSEVCTVNVMIKEVWIIKGEMCAGDVDCDTKVAARGERGVEWPSGGKSGAECGGGFDDRWVGRKWGERKAKGKRAACILKWESQTLAIAETQSEYQSGGNRCMKLLPEEGSLL